MNETERSQYNFMLSVGMLEQRNAGNELLKLELPQQAREYIEKCIAIGDLFHNSKPLDDGTLDYSWVKGMVESDTLFEKFKHIMESQ